MDFQIFSGNQVRQDFSYAGSKLHSRQVKSRFKSAHLSNLPNWNFFIWSNPAGLAQMGDPLAAKRYQTGTNSLPRLDRSCLKFCQRCVSRADTDDGTRADCEEHFRAFSISAMWQCSDLRPPPRRGGSPPRVASAGAFEAEERSDPQGEGRSWRGLPCRRTGSSDPRFCKPNLCRAEEVMMILSSRQDTNLFFLTEVNHNVSQ